MTWESRDRWAHEHRVLDVLLAVLIWIVLLCLLAIAAYAAATTDPGATP